MPDLVIPISEYIGESCWNWEFDVYERATNCGDLRLAIEYAGYRNEAFDRIVLEVGNCYGGSVADGLEMFHYLQGLGIPVHTRILGTVASMGTIFPLAGDTVEVAQTARFMVHAPSNEFWGTAAEVKTDLKALDIDTQSLADVYIARTGADAATVAAWMSQDTWFTAAEALAAGLCTAVVPLRPKTAPAPVLDATQASASRARFAEAVARADKRTAPKPATPPAATAAAPIPVPMATVPKPTPRAAAPAAKTAKPATARKTLFTQLKELFNGIDEEEETATADGSEAVVESTELDNGAFLYHDGPLAVDVAVFNDEAMTEPTPDAEYDTKDAQVVTVAAGICTAIGPSPDASATTATAALNKRLEALEANLKTVIKERDEALATAKQLKGHKPPMPTARAPRPNADAPDPKAPPVAPKAVAAHHTSL